MKVGGRGVGVWCGGGGRVSGNFSHILGKSLQNSRKFPENFRKSWEMTARFYIRCFN